MKEIRGWFHVNFTNDPELPLQVKDIIREHSSDTFDDQNPYAWMISLEDLLLPGREVDSGPGGPTRRHSGMSHITTAPKNHNYRGGNPRRPKISKMLNRWAARISDRPEDKRYIEGKLAKAHRFIVKRQDKVAEELLAWRDGQVALWSSLLEERYPKEMVNGVGTVELAAGPREAVEQ